MRLTLPLRLRGGLRAEARREMLDELFFEGPELVPYLFRLGSLMGLSAVIASLGLIGDSSAVVIGAMLVAPLMTPIMASSAALVMGWPARLLEAALLVAAASAEAIAVGWIVSALVPAFRPVLLSHELLSRTEPTLLDLAIAVAAGAAGGYVTVHRKAAGALPGVAIAVAVVPPLAAVGVLLQLHAPHLATGALLLYLTNLVSIVLAASVVFLLTGFVPRALAGRHGWRIGVGIATTLVAVGAVAYPLTRESGKILRKAHDEQAVSSAVQSWLDGTGLGVDAVQVDELPASVSVTVDVSGPKPPPPASALADRVGSSVHRRVTLKVRWTNLRQETASSP